MLSVSHRAVYFLCCSFGIHVQIFKMPRFFSIISSSLLNNTFNNIHIQIYKIIPVFRTDFFFPHLCTFSVHLRFYFHHIFFSCTLLLLVPCMLGTMYELCALVMSSRFSFLAIQNVPFHRNVVGCFRFPTKWKNMNKAQNVPCTLHIAHTHSLLFHFIIRINCFTGPKLV